MKLFDIDSIEKANKFLPEFIERFNKKFSIKPKDPEHAFTKSPEKKDLLLALTIRHNRKVGTGSMISFQGKGNNIYGNIKAIYQENVYDLVEIEYNRERVEQDKENTVAIRGEKDMYKPSKEHPWRRWNPGYFGKRKELTPTRRMTFCLNCYGCYRSVTLSSHLCKPNKLNKPRQAKAKWRERGRGSLVLYHLTKKA